MTQPLGVSTLTLDFRSHTIVCSKFIYIVYIRTEKTRESPCDRGINVAIFIILYTRPMAKLSYLNDLYRCARENCISLIAQRLTILERIW